MRQLNFPICGVAPNLLPCIKESLSGTWCHTSAYNDSLSCMDLCPAGYTCENRTHPTICSPGYYCGEGVVKASICTFGLLSCPFSGTIHQSQLILRLLLSILLLVVIILYNIYVERELKQKSTLTQKAIIKNDPKPTGIDATRANQVKSLRAMRCIFCIICINVEPFPY